MTTNNIAILQPGQHTVTVLTGPTARILFVFTVLARRDDLLLLPAPGQAQALARHLRGQIFFMDKVKVDDQSAQWARLRVVGPQAHQTLAAAQPDAPALAPHHWMALGDSLVLHQTDYDLPGYEWLVPSADAPAQQAHWREQQILPVAPADYEARRIELGRPAPDAELTGDYSPLEAGLAWTCAENKGCYTGQEIIARQITYDKVTKSLVGLRSATLLPVGAEITVDGRAVGVVTSAALSPTLQIPLALAVVKRPHNVAGTLVQSESTSAEVTALPFVELGQ
jgi:folate-binding protein YgfZ